MKLTVGYHHLYHDWYVGEFYIKFTEFLKTIPGLQIEYKHLNEFAQYYNCKTDYNNGLPSVFSPYNLIIQNESNGKTFIHSWHDYAPAILVNGSGIENFDAVKFSCVSRLDQNFIDSYNGTAKIQPSVYILENTSEFDFIEKNRNNEKINSKIYMNALCHGPRERYIDVLNKSEKFNLKKKDKGGHLVKNKYYEEFSSYKYALNLDGVAKICYRDLESFGLGCLLFREKLNVLTYEQLEVDKHYIELIDDDIKSKINDDSQIPYVIDKVENKINDVVNSGLGEHIVNESRNWYERNCLPENQVKIIHSFLEDFEIFK
jgi:hypothetical protein